MEESGLRKEKILGLWVSWRKSEVELVDERERISPSPFLHGWAGSNVKSWSGAVFGDEPGGLVLDSRLGRKEV